MPGYGGQPGAAQSPAKAGLQGYIDAALAAGRDGEALLLAYGVVVADPEKGPQMMQKYRWYRGLKQPALAVRWGIGVHYVKPTNFSGSPKPIGEKQNLPTKRTGRSGGGPPGSGELGVPGGYGGAGIPGMPGGDMAGGGGGGFKSLTGELGDKILERLQNRIDRGDYGDLLKEAPKGGQRGGGFAGGGYAGAPGGAIPGVPGGDGAPGAIPGMPGDPGAGGYGVPGGGGGGAARMPAGVSYLGEGEPRELLKKAEQAGIDALLIFDVQVSQNPRTNLITNDTEIELYSVDQGKRIAGTKKLNNIAVQQLRESGKDADSVGKEIDKIFEVVDLGYRGTDLPAGLLPEQVQGRVNTLIADAQGNPLSVLAELRFWNSRQLLGDSEMKAAFAELVGNEAAETLVSGSLQDRIAAAQKWLASGQPSGAGAAGAPRPFR